MKTLHGLFLLLPILFAGCKEDSAPTSIPTPQESTQLAGYWTFELTVTANSNCGAPVGTHEQISAILGTGESSAYLSVFGDLISLNVDGSRATGSQQVGDTNYVVELNANGDGLTGKFRVTRSLFGTTQNCVRDYDLDASRNAEAAGFADVSDWQVLISARESSCSGVNPTLFDECLSLRRDGFAVSMRWPAGELAGTATEDRIVLMQVVENSAIRLDLIVDGDAITGELRMTDTEARCGLLSDVDADRNGSSCGIASKMSPEEFQRSVLGMRH